MGQKTKEQKNHKQEQYHENPKDSLKNPPLQTNIERVIEGDLEKTEGDGMEIGQAEVCDLREQE